MHRYEFIFPAYLASARLWNVSSANTVYVALYHTKKSTLQQQRKCNNEQAVMESTGSIAYCNEVAGLRQ